MYLDSSYLLGFPYGNLNYGLPLDLVNNFNTPIFNFGNNFIPFNLPIPIPEARFDEKANFFQFPQPYVVNSPYEKPLVQNNTNKPLSASSQKKVVFTHEKILPIEKPIGSQTSISENNLNIKKISDLPYPKIDSYLESSSGSDDSIIKVFPKDNSEKFQFHKKNLAKNSIATELSYLKSESNESILDFFPDEKSNKNKLLLLKNNNDRQFIEFSNPIAKQINEYQSNKYDESINKSKNVVATKNRFKNIDSTYRNNEFGDKIITSKSFLPKVNGPYSERNSNYILNIPSYPVSQPNCNSDSYFYLLPKSSLKKIDEILDLIVSKNNLVKKLNKYPEIAKSNDFAFLPYTTAFLKSNAKDNLFLESNLNNSSLQNPYSVNKSFSGTRLAQKSIMKSNATISGSNKTSESPIKSILKQNTNLNLNSTPINKKLEKSIKLQQINKNYFQGDDILNSFQNFNNAFGYNFQQSLNPFGYDLNGFYSFNNFDLYGLNLNGFNGGLNNFSSYDHLNYTVNPSYLGLNFGYNYGINNTLTLNGFYNNFSPINSSIPIQFMI